MSDNDKGGGFGSLPGDLFEDLIKYFSTTPPLSAALEPYRVKILAQVAKTEHAAANAMKNPYGVDIAFKCISMVPEFNTAKDAKEPDAARGQAMQNVLDILQGLEQLWK